MSDSEKARRNGLVSGTLREIMRDSEEYIFVKDKNSVYAGGSEAFAQMAGLASAAGLAGKTDLDIFPRDIAEKYRGDDKRVLESGEPITGILERLPDLDGKPRWVRTWKRVLHGPDGEIAGLYGVGRDVSNEVLLGERVKTAEDYIRLISRIPCGVAILHREGEDFCLDFANDGFLEVHHHAGKEIVGYIGSCMLRYVWEPDRRVLLEAYDRVRGKADLTGNANYRVTGRDGRLHWVSIRFRAAYEKDGTQFYYVAYNGLDKQKRTEEKLEESRCRLEESILNTDLQFFTYYPGQARCENLTLNSRLAGIPAVWEKFPDDFLAYARLSAKDAGAYREMVAAIDRGEDRAECTVRLDFRGEAVWEKIAMRAVRDGGGHTVRAQGNAIDVTERIESAERLRRERVRLKTLEGSVFESFSFNLTKQSQPEFQTRDEAMLHTQLSAEFQREALRLCPTLERIAPEIRNPLLRAAARIPDRKDRERFLCTCGGGEMRASLRDGHYSAKTCYRRMVGDNIRWVESSAEVLPDPDSGDLIAFFYTSDIHADVVRELITGEVFERNYACVSCLDLRSGVFSVVSGTDREVLSLNGMQYADALRTAAGRFIAEEDAAHYAQSLRRDAILAALADRRFYTVYNRRREAAEELPGRPPRRMKNDIFYLDGHHDTLVFLLSDVTAIFEQERESRERLETALLAARQASSAKSNFLSRMSHEIRTPLNAIIGMDTIAAQSINNPEKAADCVAKIGLSARYLLSLINDILDMSRIESGKMLLKSESFPFAEFIAGVNNIIYPQVRAKGVEYECTVSNEVCEAYCGDEMKLQQVLVNVLGNAVKFTERGKITLDVSVADREQNREKLRFVVSDTGCGIAEEDLGRIFDAFEQVDTSTTTVFGGTGLGLAITKNLVELMGGGISVRSIAGIGSEFTIDVPLTADETAERPQALRQNLRNLHTLIVDDDLMICEQAQDILRSIGMTGEWVTSGREAVGRVRVRAADGKNYDFILIDWKMPDMDGIETTRQIRQIVGPDVTIIIISAYDWQSIEAEARAAGANMMVSKPLLRATLVSAFERALGEEKSAERKKPEFDFTGKRVLVAEDNDLNAEIARTLLESKNFSVDRAPNGLKTLEQFVQSPKGYYDAILMDVRMPMMDGLQTTANIRHWGRPDARTIPIIAMTANAFDEDVEKSRAAGMNAHLSKPIDPELLYSTLERLIGSADGEETAET